MGHWAMHIEGTGIHDNGLDNDAENLLKAFVDDLAAKGQTVARVSFTVGGARELLNTDDTTPLRSGETQYRSRLH